jgi:DNA-binding MarR family transcriptional regulator
MLGHRSLVEVLKEHDLRLPQYAVLVALLDFGDLAPHELASRLQTDRSHISAYTEMLVNRDLVTRVPDVTDRRRVTVQLTPAGRDLVEHLTASAADSQQFLLDALSDDEQRTLRALLTKVIVTAEAGHPSERALAASSS